MRNFMRGVGIKRTTDWFHKPNDEIYPFWRYDGIIQSLETLYHIGRYYASDGERPSLKPENPFNAARRIQQVLLREYPDLELTIIGLFCYECFDYYKLKEETARLLGVDLDSAEKTQIHKGKYIVQVDGKEHAVNVKELNNAVEERCLDCPDFTAKYADISLGSVGSDEGYSTVIVRSDVGEKLSESLDLAKGKVKKDEVTKLSVRKKKRANLSRSEK